MRNELKATIEEAIKADEELEKEKEAIIAQQESINEAKSLAQENLDLIPEFKSEVTK